MRFLSFVAGALSLASAAAADNHPLTDEDAALTEFRGAVDRAVALGDRRWAFTIDYEDAEAAPGRIYRLRFDPRRARDDRWTLIAPAENALSKDERKEMKKAMRNDEADEALVYDRLGGSLDGARFESMTGEEAIFGLTIDDGEMPADARDAIVTIARLDRKAGYVSSIETQLIRPFKRAPIAKLEKLRHLQRFAPAGPNGEVLLVEVSSEVSGSAMMKKFSSNVRIVYSDFEPVDAPPREKAE